MRVVEDIRELLQLSEEEVRGLVVLVTIPAPTRGKGLCRVCNQTVVDLPALECRECAEEKSLHLLLREAVLGLNGGDLYTACCREERFLRDNGKEVGANICKALADMCEDLDPALAEEVGR